jgi:hypothetical protein
VQHAADTPWYDCGDAVPLTGREPELGRIRDFIGRRESAGRWLQIVGPRRAGSSRLLGEIESWLGSDGGPPAICVHPVPGVRLGAIHRPLRHLLAQDEHWSLRRAIGALMPDDRDARAVLAVWLEAPSRVPDIQPALIAGFLGRIAARGPVLVHDLDGLDERSREVLRLAAAREGLDIVATGSGAAARSATPLALAPLSSAQIELLLRRWLRNGAAARRLAGPLSASCDGWPGRVVEAVRTLAADGLLAPGRRGVGVVTRPACWPDGLAIDTPGARVAEEPTRPAAAEAGLLADVLRGAGACLTRDDLPGARSHLREAARVIAPSDLEGRAGWHRAMASVAAASQRAGVARAHRRRAARLLLACGAVRAAARVLAELGTAGVRGPRPLRSLAFLARARRIHELIGEREHGARYQGAAAALRHRVRTRKVRGQRRAG